MALKYVQALTQYLAGGGVLIGSTNAVLASFTDIYGNAITSITPFGVKGYITFEPDTTNEEAAIFTSVTVNANGTVTLGGIATALAQSPYTETAGTQRSHSGGTKVVITDNVAFWNTFGNKQNDETLTGRWSTAVVPLNGVDIVNKTYADGLSFAGAPNASTIQKGILQLPTQAQVDAKTATGSTGAALAVTPDVQRSTLLSDYVVDTGGANAYTIAPSPVITAYTTGQRFTFKAVSANTTVSTLAVNGLAVKTIKKVGGGTDLAANDILAGQVVEVEYDGTNFQMLNPVGNAPATTASLTAALKFGGTGADGALAISSGTTTIDLANAAVVVKNYTSVAITGTAVLAFINPNTDGTIIQLKSQGAVTLTSSATPMIDCSALGGAAGAVVSGGTSGGNSGSSAFGWLFTVSGGGGGIGGSGTATGGSTSVLPNALNAVVKHDFLAPGSGGGSGGQTVNGSGSTSGVGGGGGGSLYIECAGAWTFTTGTISVAGINGGNGVVGGGGAGTSSSGGGGGGGGTFYALVGSIVSNSGTVTVTGGTGGTAANSGADTSGGGAGGGSVIAAGGNKTAGAGGTVGANGATGLSFGVKVNSDYA